MRVCGPILYLNEWTLDGRMLVRHDGLALLDPIPIVVLYDQTEPLRIVGAIDEIDVFRNEVWAVGEMHRHLPRWRNQKAIYVTAAVAGGEARDEDCCGRSIVFGGPWLPVQVVVHGTEPLPELWPGKQTWLEEE